MFNYKKQFFVLFLIITAACGGKTSTLVESNPPAGDPLSPDGIVSPQEESFSPSHALSFVVEESNNPYGLFTNPTHQLYWMDIRDPSTLTRLTDGIISFLEGPQWNPQGDGLVYLFKDSVHPYETYLMAFLDPSLNSPLLMGSSLNDVGYFESSKWSPDGQWLAYSASLDGNSEHIYLVDREGDITIINPDLVEDIGDIFWSPLGDQIAFISDRSGFDQVYVYDLTSGLVSGPLGASLIDGNEHVTNFRWAPDGESIVYIADLDLVTKNELYQINLDSPEVATKLNSPFADDYDIKAFNWSPQGNYLAYVRSSQIPYDLDGDGFADGLNPVDRLYLYSVVDHTSTLVNTIFQNLDGSARRIGFFYWSPTGDYLAYTIDAEEEDSIDIYLVDTLANSIKITDPSPPGYFIQYARWSPDGSFLGYIRHNFTNPHIRELLVYDLVNHNDKTVSVDVEGVVSTLRGVLSFAWNPDSSKIAYYSDSLERGVFELFLIDLSSGIGKKLNRDLSDLEDVAANFRWSPDGKALAYGIEHPVEGSWAYLYWPETEVTLSINSLWEEASLVRPVMREFRFSPVGWEE
ncbi:MAG: PD40 domain-containing protein [Deltaproteobacteria bacterium]|nr:PD40 domain-containing protein [Deltaproteobacteria bacterium]